MSPRRIALCLALLAPSLGGCQVAHPGAVAPAIAAPAPAPPDPVTPDPATRLASRVTFVADDAPLEEVLDSIGRQIGWNVVLEPGARDERVRLHLRDVEWRDALDFLCARHRLEVELAGDHLLYVTRPPRVTIEGCF